MDLNIVIGMTVGLVSVAIALVTPIIKLNATITKLNSNLLHMQTSDYKRDERLDSHAGKIDGLEVTVARHGVEISHLKYVNGLYEGKMRNGKT